MPLVTTARGSVLRAAALASGTPVVATKVALGSGRSTTPTAQTALVTPLNPAIEFNFVAPSGQTRYAFVEHDDGDTTARIIIDSIQNSDAYDFTEIGLFAGNDLIAYESAAAGATLGGKTAGNPYTGVISIQWGSANPNTVTYTTGAVLPATTQRTGLVRLTDDEEVLQGTIGTTTGRWRGLAASGGSLWVTGNGNQMGRISTQTAQVDMLTNLGITIRGIYGKTDGSFAGVPGGAGSSNIRDIPASRTSPTSRAVTGLVANLVLQGIISHQGFEWINGNVGSTGYFYQLNTATNVATVKPLSVTNEVWDSVVPLGNTIYFFGSSGAVYTATSLLDATINLTRIGTRGITTNVSGTAVLNGTIYAISGNPSTLYTVNPETGNMAYSPTVMTPEQMDARGDQRYLRTNISLDEKANLASPALTGNPTAPTPSDDDDDTSIATTAFVKNVLGSAFPPGVMLDFGGTTAPDGFLLCDGRAVSRTTYSALFRAIGVAFGGGDRSTTFNLPDFRRRTAVGAGGTASADLGNLVGSEGGEERVRLTVDQMPQHSHEVEDVRNALSTQRTGTGTRNPRVYNSLVDLTTTTAGRSLTHLNIQPSLVVTKIIKT